MIESHVAKLIRKFGPNQGTAVCLGDQLSTTGERTGDIFRSWGYSRFYDIDYNGKAEVNHDLNLPLPKLPRADLLYDGGTMEHVCNVSQALESIAKLVRVGGVLVQVVPVNTYGESFYCIDPQLPRDFYAANGFECLELFMFQKPSLTWLMVELGDRWLPKKWNKALRDKMRPAEGTTIKDPEFSVRRRLHDWIFNDGRVRMLRCDRKHIRLPRRTMLLYAGVKTREVTPTVWPHQNYYPAAMTVEREYLQISDRRSVQSVLAG
jgi:hypothetical protein